MGDFDIEEVARLARIELREEEKVSFTRDLERILSFVGEVGEVVTTEDPEGRVGEVRNVFREDDTPHAKGRYTEKLLAEAPQTEKNYVRVKKIL